MLDQPIELDAGRVIETLNRHRVRYVVIGGFATVLYGSILPTYDIDITPSPTRSNLERLAAALNELGAKLRVVGARESAAMPLDGRSFESFTTMTLRTDAGDVDVCLRPDGPNGTSFSYDVLASDAVELEIPEPVRVASLDAVITSKEAAGREKDLVRLPELYRLRERLRRAE